MGGKTATAQAGEGGDLLSAFDKRMKRIAAETYRELAGAAEAGCLRVATAAKRLDMSEYRVRQLVREGRLKAVRPTPHTLRIPMSEIRRFQEGEQ